MHTNTTEFGSLIGLCDKLLCLSKNWRISNGMRQANQIAHELAQATRFIASPQFYNYCLPCIETIIINEMN
jgi:hypothetical protein